MTDQSENKFSFENPVFSVDWINNDQRVLWIQERDGGKLVKIVLTAQHFGSPPLADLVRAVERHGETYGYGGGVRTNFGAL